MYPGYYVFEFYAFELSVSGHISGRYVSGHHVGVLFEAVNQRHKWVSQVKSTNVRNLMLLSF
jgi:hypothetical protein